MNRRYWFEPVFAVVRKDITIQFRYPTWFVASFVWPVIFPLTFFFVGRGLAGTDGQGLESFSRYAGTGDYASFLILGNLVWMFVNINLWTGGLSLQHERLRGSFDTQWCTPASRLSLVIGSTLSSVILNFFPMLASILLYSAMGVFTLSGNLASILASILLVLPFLIGFLFSFASFTLRLRETGTLVQIVRTLFSIFCGMQFPLSVLPEPLSGIGEYVPLTHFVNIIRGVVIDDRPLSAFGPSILYLLASGTIMTAAGVLFFGFMKRSVKKKGFTGGY